MFERALCRKQDELTWKCSFIFVGEGKGVNEPITSLAVTGSLLITLLIIKVKGKFSQKLK